MLNAPKVTGNKMRAYLSILLVPELQADGVGGELRHGDFVGTPKAFVVV